MAKQIVHTEQCRKRMEESMRKTAKGRKWLGESDTKIAEYMEKAHDDKERADKKSGAEEPSTPESQIEVSDPAVVETTSAETPLEQRVRTKMRRGLLKERRDRPKIQKRKKGKKEKG